MPAVQPSSSSSLVLVTGATGYIAAWVVRCLLVHGYDVRGTVRSTSKGQQLLEIFQKLTGYGGPKFGKFDFVIVEDIAKELGAFDEAVKGVDAVEHVASPFHFDADDPNDIIEPAVKGTVRILQSVSKFGEKVKRVVITSSCGAISAENFGKPVTFDETNWNDASVKQVREQGKKALGGTKYGASKTLAEKAVWDFVSANPSLLWDIVTINPPFVNGPTTNHVPSPENLGTSATDWYKTLMTQHAGGKSLEFLATKCYSWIDVRDVAEAHVRALAKEEAGGNRIIISTEPFCWQEFLDIALNSLTPSPYTKHPLARGNPGAGSSAEPLSIYRLDRAKQLLGMSNEEGSDWKYKTKEETTRDTLAEFAAKDW